MGTVIGGLLLPRFDAGDYGRSVNQGILGGSQLAQGQTALLALQEEKQKQQSMQMVYEAIQANPALAQQLLGGGSILGSLGPGGGGPPGAGPLTQQATMPGQPPGAPQVVPGGQDLSQFATQGGPPQSTLASLGPQGGIPGQPQGQPPQNPLLAMAATNPRAAMLLQGQMQAQQDRQMAIQGQRLKMGSAMMESLGQMAQGVTDQAGWDQLRQDAAQIDPKLAARLQPVYSKEARDRLVAQAVDVKDALTLQVNEMKARADQIRAGLAGRTDAVNTELEIMGLTPATASPAQLKEAADKAEARQVRIHKAGVTPQIVEGEGGVKYSIDPHTLERRPIPGGPPGTATGTAAGGTPGASTEPMRAPMSDTEKKAAGYTSRMQEGQTHLNELEASGDYTSWKAPLAQMPGGRLLLTEKQKAYEAAKGVFLAGLLRYDSAGQITEKEWKQYGDLYFPQPDDPPSTVELKRKYREQTIKTHQEMIGRPLPGQPQGGQPQGQPTSQGSTGAGKPVSQMSREEIAAEIAAIKKRGGA